MLVVTGHTSSTNMRSSLKSRSKILGLTGTSNACGRVESEFAPTKDVVSEKFRYNVVRAAFKPQDAVIANIDVGDVVKNHWVRTVLEDNLGGFSGLHV